MPSVQERFTGSQTVKGGVKLKAPSSEGHGGAKVDPNYPIYSGA